jgi:hypothetical protein
VTRLALLAGLMALTGGASAQPAAQDGTVERTGILRKLSAQWVLALPGAQADLDERCITLALPPDIRRQAARLEGREVVVEGMEIHEPPVEDDVAKVVLSYRGGEFTRVCASPKIILTTSIRRAPRKR